MQGYTISNDVEKKLELLFQPCPMANHSMIQLKDERLDYEGIPPVKPLKSLILRCKIRKFLTKNDFPHLLKYPNIWLF